MAMFGVCHAAGQVTLSQPATSLGISPLPLEL